MICSEMLVGFESVLFLSLEVADVIASCSRIHIPGRSAAEMWCYHKQPWEWSKEAFMGVWVYLPGKRASGFRVWLC